MRGLLLVLALAGCAAVQPLVNPVDGILADAVAAARGPASEQQAALARAQQLGVQNPADRLRLATLLAMLPPPLRVTVSQSEESTMSFWSAATVSPPMPHVTPSCSPSSPRTWSASRPPS